MTGINNQGEDGTDNRLVVDYSVIFSNVLNNVVASSNYYISSGVVIADYYNEVGLLILTMKGKNIKYFFSTSNIFSRPQIFSLNNLKIKYFSSPSMCGYPKRR